MQLTKHFALAELACRCGCGGEKDPKITAELKRLAETILQPLRDELGKPVHINSGYRCPAHNKACGGAAKSYHMRGMAADVTVAGLTPQAIAKAAADNKAVGGLTPYPDQGFCHLDTRKGRVTWGT